MCFTYFRHLPLLIEAWPIRSMLIHLSTSVPEASALSLWKVQVCHTSLVSKSASWMGNYYKQILFSSLTTFGSIMLFYSCWHLFRPFPSVKVFVEMALMSSSCSCLRRYHRNFILLFSLIYGLLSFVIRMREEEAIRMFSWVYYTCFFLLHEWHRWVSYNFFQLFNFLWFH